MKPQTLALSLGLSAQLVSVDAAEQALHRLPPVSNKKGKTLAECCWVKGQLQPSVLDRSEIL